MTFRVLAILAVLFAFAGCGGGGGGGSPSNAPSNGGPAIDTVVVGDALFVVQDQLFLRGTTSCRGTVCTLTILGEKETVDLKGQIDPNATSAITDQQVRDGVRLGRIVGADGNLRFNTFGVWGKYNAASPTLGSGRVQGSELQFTMPVSLGTGSGSNPLTGSATWKGAMVGVKVGAFSLGAEVTGAAELSTDLGTSSLDLAFTNIAERSGAISPDIRWTGVSMRAGSFHASGLDGRFYGPNQEEAGGVFERSGVTGAFSLARQ